MAEKTTAVAGGASTVSVIAAALSCTSCYPALAGLATAIGLGTGWNPGVSYAFVIPYLLGFSLLVFAYEFYKHSNIGRYVLMSAGPIIALVFKDVEPVWMFNVAIAYMLITSVYNIMRPKHRVCGVDGKGCK